MGAPKVYLPAKFHPLPVKTGATIRPDISLWKSAMLTFWGVGGPLSKKPVTWLRGTMGNSVVCYSERKKPQKFNFPDPDLPARTPTPKFSKNAKPPGGAPMGPNFLPFGTYVGIVETYPRVKFHPLPVHRDAGNEVQSSTYGAP